MHHKHQVDATAMQQPWCQWEVTNKVKKYSNISDNILSSIRSINNVVVCQKQISDSTSESSVISDKLLSKSIIYIYQRRPPSIKSTISIYDFHQRYPSSINIFIFYQRYSSSINDIHLLRHPSTTYDNPLIYYP